MPVTVFTRPGLNPTTVFVSGPFPGPAMQDLSGCGMDPVPTGHLSSQHTVKSGKGHITCLVTSADKAKAVLRNGTKWLVECVTPVSRLRHGGYLRL